jgi:hypothetical protein
MRGRSLVARAIVAMLAVTIGSSLLASCVEGATSTPTEQMACCKKGHNSCPMRGTPEHCCTSTPHFDQCTAVQKFSSQAPHLFALHVFDEHVASATIVWSPTPVAYAPSPPGSKHPTYLVLSALRI